MFEEFAILVLHSIRYHLFTPKLLSISVPGDLRQIIGWVIPCDPIPSVARKYPISSDDCLRLYLGDYQSPGTMDT